VLTSTVYTRKHVSFRRLRKLRSVSPKSHIFLQLILSGAFWLGLAATFQPFYNSWGAYGTATNPAQGLSSPDYLASFAFFFLAMGLMCFIYLICSLRTNVAFVIIFLTLVVAFSCLAGTYWQVANGNAAMAGKLQKTAGAFLFITCASGWWIFLAQMLAALDFPIQLPGTSMTEKSWNYMLIPYSVGDLSTFIKGASQRARAKEHV
jgi:uncharacterized protein